MWGDSGYQGAHKRAENLWCEMDWQGQITGPVEKPSLDGIEVERWIIMGEYNGRDGRMGMLKPLDRDRRDSTLFQLTTRRLGVSSTLTIC